MASEVHTFHALAFVENFSLKELTPFYPEAKRVHQYLVYPAAAGGTVFIYSFGAVVFHNMGQAGRESELWRLRQTPMNTTDAQVISDEFTVREVSGARPEAGDSSLVVDELNPERASMVALTVAQSVAMEYYERIVDQMFADTDRYGQQLETSGSLPIFYTRRLHRFIGQAITTRSEVLSVLHLLDKPDVVWDDPGAERIYEEMRSDLDLVDRYQALEQKLQSVQEALSLVTEVVRDRRLFLLEAAIVALIVFEIILSFIHP